MIARTVTFTTSKKLCLPPPKIQHRHQAMATNTTPPSSNGNHYSKLLPSQSDAVSLGLDWPIKTRRGMGTSLPPYFPTSLLPCDLLRQSMSMAPATVRHRHTPRAAGSHHTHQDMNRVVTRMVSGQFAHHKMVTTKGTKHKRSALHHEAITHSLHTLPNQQRASWIFVSHPPRP